MISDGVLVLLGKRWFSRFFRVQSGLEIVISIGYMCKVLVHHLNTKIGGKGQLCTVLFFFAVVAFGQMSRLILIYYNDYWVCSVVLISVNCKHKHILLVPTLMYVENWWLPVWVC